jgi:adenylate cyclase
MSDVRFLQFRDLVAAALSRPEAEAEINRRYRREVAIMVCDFTGMVERTDAHGIVYSLALAAAAEDAMHPAIKARGGEVVKRVADTFFAVFASPEAALHASFEALAALGGFNHSRTGTIHDGSRNDPIAASIGLGWGDALIIPGADAYGDEVNRAFVLGEDIARGGEVLCSSRFLAAVQPLTAGFGAFVAPADRQAEAGFPFHVLGDYRD